MNFRQIFDQLSPEERSQTNARKVLKAFADGRRLKAKARFVLVLDGRGNPKRCVVNLEYFANVIAVLGPARPLGVLVPEAVILEIGISRTRPYRATERVTRAGGKKIRTERFSERVQARSIRHHELAKIWPTLEKMFSSATSQARKRWKSRDAWPVGSSNGVWWFERGIYFSVDIADHVAHLFFLHEEERRRQAFLSEYAGRIAEVLRRYRRPSYSDKRLRRLARLRNMIHSWKHARLSHEERGVVFTALPQRDKFLFGRCLTAFELERPQPVPVRKIAKPKYPFLENGQLRLVRSQGSVHGRTCATFEFAFKKDYREAYCL